RAVDDPLPFTELGGGTGGRRVGAGAWLGQAESGQLLARGKLGQPLPLLLLRAEEQDRHRPKRGVRGHRDRDRGVDPGQLLDGDRVRKRVGPRAAVLLGDRHPHQPELGELRHEVVGKAVLAVELRGYRRDLFLRELADGAADELVLGREVEVHAARREASSTISRTPYPVPPRWLR